MTDSGTRDPLRGKLLVNGATSQLDRHLEPLEDDFVAVDGRSFAQLLDFAPRFGRLVNFYDLEDRIDGDWVDFFLTDSTMILAAIAALDPDSLEAEWHEKLRRLRRSGSPELLRWLLETTVGLAQSIDRWLRGLKRSSRSRAARLLRQQIESAIQDELAEQLRWLEGWLAGLPEGPEGVDTVVLDFRGFLPQWRRGGGPPKYEVALGPATVRAVLASPAALEQSFDTFLQAIDDWRGFAAEQLEATLQEPDHRPQIGLYIAFARLFQNAQGTLNSLAARYVRFYYQDILRESPRGPIPDQLYLSFTLETSAEVASAPVPAGTLFPAGQDEAGEAILYAADRSLAVSAAELARIRTVRVVDGPLWIGWPPGEPGPGDPPRPSLAPQQILASEILTGDDASGLPTEPWKTFGPAVPGSSTGSSLIETTERAQLGFAVASPYLLLEGGTRTVRLFFHFRDPGLGRLLRELAAATGWTVPRIFRQVLDNAFDLYLSTAEGWLPVESYEALLPHTVELEPLPDKLDRFELRFELPPQAPPIVAFDPDADDAGDDDAFARSEDPAVLATNPDSTEPTLKVYLRQERTQVGEGPGLEVRVFPLALLAGMQLQRLRIHAQVSGLETLEVANTDGEVDTSSPFLAFGGLPTVGSYLDVTQAELFVKRLDSLALRLGWFDLPPNERGFAGYYRDYKIGLDGKPQEDLFDNRKFQGRIEVRNPGNWTLVDDKPAEVYLFRTEEDCAAPEPLPDAPLCDHTDFRDLELESAALPEYYDPAASSIRLELSDPPYAFGNDLYPQNVLAAVIADLPNTEKCQVECSLECDPLEEAASCVQACIECLRLSSADAAAVERCITACLECLFAVFLAAYKACTQRCADEEADPATLDWIESRMNELLNRDPSDWSRALESLSGELRSRAGSDSAACFDACWDRYRVILDAMGCVEACAQRCQGDLTCLTSCLEECRSDLMASYTNCLQSCMGDCMSLDKELEYPNEPYLPRLLDLSVSYSAHCDLRPTRPATAECGSFFWLWPFGGASSPEPSREAAAPTAPLRATAAPLLPPFPDRGNLYLGFTDLQLPQALTLLFEMTAGGAEKSLPLVTWDQLSGNRWQQLAPHEILFDTTHGLENTGVLALDLPADETGGTPGGAQESDASETNTVLPADYRWLRASVPEQAGRFPETVQVIPHVTTATWLPGGTEELPGSATGEHLDRPLPAHTITGSVQDLPDIATVDQPLQSFGGRPAETRPEFQLRLGERLRHKDRGLLGWDYERLVLERFPTVWKVQTLPARDARGRVTPGAVTVVVVPGPESTERQDPTTPRATGDELRHIRDYLARRSSPFVDLRVVNPVYVRLQVTASVKFFEHEEPGAAAEELDSDLVRYLSPWFYDARRAARGGAYVSQADVTEFVATRPYVETLQSIRFRYEPSPESLDSEWCFVTSAEEHVILEAWTGTEIGD